MPPTLARKRSLNQHVPDGEILIWSWKRTELILSRTAIYLLHCCDVHRFGSTYSASDVLLSTLAAISAYLHSLHNVYIALNAFNPIACDDVKGMTTSDVYTSLSLKLYI